MLQPLRHRLEGQRDDGFTLIELMVVVLIIAILIAIAIPTFLGARTRAQDRAAQSSLRNSLTAAKTIYTDSQDYTAITQAKLAATEPSLSFAADSTAVSTGQNSVAWKATNATTFFGGVLSASGTCFYIKDSVAAGSSGTTYSKTATAADCTGDKAALATYSATPAAGW
jgi:type IV pilus assembly protein PilA